MNSFTIHLRTGLCSQYHFLPHCFVLKFCFKVWVLIKNSFQLDQSLVGKKSMKFKKEERQPLLTSQNEPVNDVYDRTPIPPRPGTYLKSYFLFHKLSFHCMVEANNCANQTIKRLPSFIGN